MVELIY